MDNIKFVHSFWSKPLFDKKFGDFNACLMNILLDYAYSAACIHNNGYKIVLYADKKGQELLSFIPYDDVYDIEIPDNINVHFAAQIKFAALRKMQKNDVLIDGDIFIESKAICDNIQNDKSDLLYSFDESNDTIFMKSNKDNIVSYYDKLLSKLNQVEGFKFSVPTMDQLRYPNTSLLKISNGRLKREYVNQYFYHLNLLKDIDFENTWPDLIIEQYFIWNYVDRYNIKPVVDYNIVDPGYIHLGNAKTMMQSKVRQKLYFLDKQLMKDAIKTYRTWEIQ